MVSRRSIRSTITASCRFRRVRAPSRHSWQPSGALSIIDRVNAPIAHDAPGASDPGPRHRLDHEPVLIVSGCTGATRRYRCLNHAEQLFLRGIPVRVVSPWQHDIVDAGLGHGFVILHRVAWDPTVQMLIDQTRDTGGVALFDIDDLVFEPESTPLHRGVVHLPPDEQDLYHDGVRRYRRTLLACDGAIVPTAFLAERIRALGLPAWISRNCVDVELLERSRRAARDVSSRRPAGDELLSANAEGGRSSSEGRVAVSYASGGATNDEADSEGRVVIGYASGSRTHDQDFAEAAGPAVLRIMERRPEVELRIVGQLDLGFGWDAVRERVRHIGHVDWRALPAEIAQSDISLAPLEIENPFCMAKSELKWLEASACGVPTVASATEAFRSAIQDGLNGLLATDTESWELAIESLIARPAHRAEIGAAACETIEGRRTTAAQAESFERTLAEARATLRPETRPPDPPVFVDGRPGRGLKVTILAPEPAQGSGGHTTLMRMVAGLEAAGHAVTVIIEPGPHMRDASERAVEEFVRAHFPKSAAKIRFGAAIEPCDVAIATGWTTALRVAVAECARTKLYFVQDFEPYFQPLSADSLAAKSTYSLGLGHITIGPWLADTLHERFGARAVAIDFGVEHEIYFPAAIVGGGASAGSAANVGGGASAGGGAIAEVGARSGSAAIAGVGAITGSATIEEGEAITEVAAIATPRVVFYGRGSTPRRGVALGLEALAHVKAARPEVEIVLYGGDRPGLADFPHVHAGVLSRPELAALYRSATVGLALSYTNLSLVPIEMAACGLPVVAIDAEPVRWYQRDGETCHVVAPTVEAIADGILRVLDDKALREQLASGGLRTVADMTWERATAQFVQHVEDYVTADVSKDLSTDVTAHSRGIVAPCLDWLSGVPNSRLVAIGFGKSDAWSSVGGSGDSGGSSGQSAVGSSIGSIGWHIDLNSDGLRRVELRVQSGGLVGDADLVLQILEHASSPRAIATVAVPMSAILDEAWTAFDLKPLTSSAGRRLHLRLSALAAPRARTAQHARSLRPTATGMAETSEEDATPAAAPPIAWLEVDEAGRPAHRTWSCGPTAAGVSRASIAIRAADDPEVRDLLHRRRRDLALRRLRLAQLRRRRILAALTRFWWRWTRPVPAGPLRPWRADAPASEKFFRGLTIYGPLPVARELVSWLRFSLGARRK